jgi:UTP:GlnB (protein PII) uridylyltransferase
MCPSVRLGVMVKRWTSKDNRSGRRGGSPGWYRELVELGALFLAVALADLFANMLAHRPLGPVVLISLGVSLLLSAALHRRYTHSPAHPPRLPRAARPPSNAVGTSSGAAKARNLWRVRTAVRNNPGSLAALMASLASHGLNILSVQIHAVADGAVDEFLLEAPSGTAGSDVVAATETGGGHDVHAVRADMHDLVDVPIRVLRLAAQVTGTRMQLAAALRALLGASTVSRQDWDGNNQGEADQVHKTTMRLGDPAGGILTFERPTLPFTPAEFARARALRDLAPPPPLVRLTSTYRTRPRQQTAIERTTEQHRP